MSQDNVERPAAARADPGSGPTAGFGRRMLGDSAIYGLGGVANQALAIILVPLYARQLGVENYGTLAILTTTLTLATMVAALALPQAFFRSYLKEAADDRARAAVLRTSLGLRLVVSVVALLLFSAVSVQLAVLLLGSTDEWPLVALIGPIVFLDSLNLVPLSYLRAQRRPVPYATLAFVRAVLGSLLIVIFVVIAQLGVMGVILGSLGSSLVTTGIGIGLLAREKQLVLGFDRSLVRHMLTFSLPLVPAAVAGWTLNLSDRYVIGAVEGRQAVGVYSAGYTVGLVINALAIAPFTLAWGAAYWEIARSPDARRVISRILTAFVATACFAALGLAALATDAFRILLTPEFEAGRFVTPFSAFGYVLYGVYTIVTTGLNLESRTGRVPFILIGAAVANVLLNVLLVPLLGYMGAAVATLLSYGLLAIGGGVISQRVYAVPWDLGRTCGLMGLGLGLAAAALLGPDHAAWRVACLAAYPVVAVGFRLAPPEVISSLLRMVRGRERVSTRPGR